MSGTMNQVLCKGGMHYVPRIAIVERRNGRLICSVCVAMIKARMAGKSVARPVEQESQVLPNRQFRMLRR